MPIEKLSRQLKTPKQVQKYLRQLKYNHDKDKPTLRSAHSAIKKNKAHCFEATFVAAAILEKHGYPPLVVSFESIDGLDHVIYVFKEKNKWGAIARSRDEGLHGRPPIYRSIRDLVWSYFEPYIDSTGCITGYQLAHLDDTKSDWRKSSKNVWKAESYLLEIKHIKLNYSKSRFKKIRSRYKKYGPMRRKPHWW